MHWLTIWNKSRNLLSRIFSEKARIDSSHSYFEHLLGSFCLAFGKWLKEFLNWALLFATQAIAIKGIQTRNSLRGNIQLVPECICVGTFARRKAFPRREHGTSDDGSVIETARSCFVAAIAAVAPGHEGSASELSFYWLWQFHARFEIRELIVGVAAATDSVLILHDVDSMVVIHIEVLNCFMLFLSCPGCASCCCWFCGFWIIMLGELWSPWRNGQRIDTDSVCAKR